MRTRGRLIGLTCAACALLALPAGASASIEVEQPRGPEATLRLPGTHGYRIEFSISQGSSEVRVEERRIGLSAANYARSGGVVTSNHVSVGFGPLAMVSARFVPSGRVVRHNEEAEICRGGPEVVRFGTFVGTVRFEGEGGYTSSVSRRVPGTLSSAPRRVCTFPDGPEHRHLRRHGKAPLLTTFLAGSDSGISFQATHSERDPTEAEYVALSSENHGGVSIFRSVFVVEAPASSFVFDPGLNSATVTPPAPFSGSASFQRIDDFATRWEGPLTVSFPGRPDVPLTGRDYAWSLSQEREEFESTFVSAAVDRSRRKVGSLSSAAPSPTLSATPGSPG